MKKEEKNVMKNKRVERGGKLHTTILFVVIGFTCLALAFVGSYVESLKRVEEIKQLERMDLQEYSIGESINGLNGVTFNGYTSGEIVLFESGMPLYFPLNSISESFQLQGKEITFMKESKINGNIKIEVKQL